MSDNLEHIDPKTPAYFLDLQLKDVRCFKGKHFLDLSDGNGRPARWTIILGENGTGKTTLVRGLGLFSYKKSEPVGIRNKDLITKTIFRLNRFDIKNRYIGYLDKNNQIEPVRENAMYSTNKDLEVLMRYNIYGYGASRRMGTGELSSYKEKDTVHSLFAENTNGTLINAEAWLLETDFAVKNAKGETKTYLKKRYELIKNTLRRLLPDVEDFRIQEITKTQTQAAIEVKTPYGWVPMKHLSHGYLTFTAWVVDLAARLVEQYPDSENPLQEPAIVLVDEIDLHLHPKWQRQIMQDLTEIFTNAQFIVTAHSPLIVQAIDDANLVLLKREGDSVKIYNNIEEKVIRDWRVDQILTSDLFGLTSSRPPKYDRLLERQRELANKHKLNKADKKELENIGQTLEKMPVGGNQNQEALEALQDALKILQNR